MELDSVRRNAGLSVQLIEKADTRDGRLA